MRRLMILKPNNTILSLLVVMLFLTASTGVSPVMDSHDDESLPQKEYPQKKGWWKSEVKKMVREQIESRGISDEQVVKVMRSTPRHLFVPERYQKSAYQDSPLPIGQGQTISQPYIVALMTHLLDLQGDEKVLEIGTGSGYQAAVLAQISKEVYTIEVIRELANIARKRLTDMNYENVHVMWGDGYQGWPAHASFDRIIVTAAPDKIPQKLVEQLKPGGKMVLPVGENFQILKVITKTADGKVVKKSITGVRFVPMVHPGKSIPSGKE